ncbi:MAG: EAL domain-containing protein [Pseudomonadota bacterium]
MKTLLANLAPDETLPTDAGMAPTPGGADGLARMSEACIHEYAESIELIRSIRDTGSSMREHQVRHWSLPASQISADFFCSAEHPRKGWYCLLADTAGHGLPSAIFSLQTPIIFREAVRLGQSLPEIFARIHAALLRQRLANYFVCGLLVRIAERDIEVVNAGMPDALLVTRDGCLLDTFASQHLPFGIEPADAVAEQRHRLARDEEAALLLYSDGLVELGAPAGDSFGENGVRAAAAVGTERIVDHLIRSIAAHGHAAHDDISIVLIRAPMSGMGTTEQEVGVDVPHVAAIDAALRIVEGFPRGLMLTDAEQRIVYVNPSFVASTGYAPAEAFGQTPEQLGAWHDDGMSFQQMQNGLREQGRWSGMLWARRKDGSIYREMLDITALRDDAGIATHYLMTFAEAGQTQEEQERIRHLALFDPLTDLANKVLLADRGEQALRRAERLAHSFAVLFIDLDRFKSINDTLGHHIGDQVLIAVARRFAGVVRECDTLGRWVGDEFICILPEIGRQQDAGLVADKIIAVLQEPIEVAGHKFKIGASIGISIYPADSEDFDELIILADRAMQIAKQAGGNLFRFYSAALHRAAEKQLEMEARLAAAIKNGELILHYQPKVNLRNWRIEGAEALVRWRDPERGLVPPGEFIPVAERSDLIATIGNWVLGEACAALARWEGRLPETFHVAVNVSPLQLARSDLFAEVDGALAVSATRPGRLQLEVTEALFIKDPKSAARTLERIAALGVTLALDDFGTGYSNLGALANLPVDTFKLDQSFVRGIDGNRTNSAIAQSVWHLADGLNKHVVVEGVETCGECRQIETMGYCTLQGYKFGKPMAETDFLAHLAAWPSAHCPYPDPAHATSASAVVSCPRQLGRGIEYWN